jgi:hypothetical protein
MATITVRKFAISLDPDEAVDFTESVDWFAGVLAKLRFERIGTYTFRFRDHECMMKVELSQSQDGYFCHLYVQAPDEHAFRAESVADAFEAHVIDTSGTRRHTLD